MSTSPASRSSARLNRPPLNPLNPKKLLHSKWTAVAPVRQEKHFMVTLVVQPTPPATRIDHVQLEAVHSKRTVMLPWRDLTDATQWRQGWL